jgi:DNA-binding MarR family transcriptional regulator
MTTTTDASAPVGVPDLGPAIGQAENVMTRLLIDVLEQTGTPENVWYAFRRLSGFAAPPTPAAFRHDVGDALGLDERAAAAILDEGVALGFMHEVTDPADGAQRVALTPAGEAARGRIRASVTAVITDLVAPLDPQDVRLTVQTLTALTERARTLRPEPKPASQPGSESASEPGPKPASQSGPKLASQSGSESAGEPGPEVRS